MTAFTLYFPAFVNSNQTRFPHFLAVSLENNPRQRL